MHGTELLPYRLVCCCLCRRNFLHLKQAHAEGKVKSVTIRGRQANPLMITFTDDLHIATGGVMAATAMVWSAHPGEAVSGLHVECCGGSSSTSSNSIRSKQQMCRYWKP
jgi:hypothetical protein